MTNFKYISNLIIFITVVVLMNALIACSENKSKEANDSKKIKQATDKYEGVTIEVDIANKNCLAILLAYDGTINRKGSNAFDPKDKNFFMGLTKNKIFDSLMNEIPSGLLEYCNAIPPVCDTLKQICKAKITFGNNTSSCEIQYCAYGSINSLPQPIKAFIDRAIELTEPWYESQQKLLQKR